MKFFNYGVKNELKEEVFIDLLYYSVLYYTIVSL